MNFSVTFTQIRIAVTWAEVPSSKIDMKFGLDLELNCTYVMIL